MKNRKKKICIIGQGFVGLPMAIAVANSQNKNGDYNFTVIGIEKNNSRGKSLKQQISQGRFPINCADKTIYKMFNKAIKKNNYNISTDYSNIANSKTIIVSINFEIDYKKKILLFF